MMRRAAIAELRDRPGPIALTVGFFDGLHRGHRAVMDSARHLAGDDGEAWALTFDPHPLAILRPELAPPLLTSLEHKLALAQRAGLDGCVVLPFSHELAAQRDHAPNQIVLCRPKYSIPNFFGFDQMNQFKRRAGYSLRPIVCAFKFWEFRYSSDTILVGGPN